MLLDAYDGIEGALEALDITPEACLLILVRGGHVSLPPFLEDDDDGSDEE